jgi:hypothetical protein
MLTNASSSKQTLRIAIVVLQLGFLGYHDDTLVGSLLTISPMFQDVTLAGARLPDSLVFYAPAR